MGVTITQSASSASRTGSGQSHEIALMATKKSRHLFGFLIFHLALRRSRDRLGRAVLTCKLHGSCEVGRGYRMGLSADACHLNIPCSSG